MKGMKRRFLGLVISLLVLLFLGIWAVIAVKSALDSGPVYTVAAVADGLAYQPSAWIGRTVKVRGMTWQVGLPSNGQPLTSVFYLSDPGTFNILLVGFGHQSALLGYLRQLPLIGTYLPRPESVLFGSIGVYRLHLTGPARSCATTSCPRAVLVDGTGGGF